MTNEIKSLLEGILEEQKKQRATLDNIQSDLMEYEKDHLLVIKLKSEVAGMRDDVDKLIKFMHDHQGKMDTSVEKAVVKGLEPVTNTLNGIAEGIETKNLPVNLSAGQRIKQEGFLLKLRTKWNKHSVKDVILGRDRGDSK